VQPEKQRIKSISRRAALLAGGKVILLSGLCARLYYLQVMEAERYRMMADDNRINLRLLAPPRGHIVDRFGASMAVNVQNYRVVIVPEQALDVEETLARLGQLIDVDAHDRRRVLRDAHRRRAFVPITVRENLSWAETSRVEVNGPDLPGISIDGGQSRHYPNGMLGAHVMGYVAAVSDKRRPPTLCSNFQVSGSARPASSAATTTSFAAPPATARSRSTRSAGSSRNWRGPRAGPAAASSFRSIWSCSDTSPNGWPNTAGPPWSR